MSDSNADAATIVQCQLDAYNAHDIEALLATYAVDAELYEHPDKLLARGRAQIRERQVARLAAHLAEPNLHARLLQRMVMGEMVIDHEEVTRTFPEGPGRIEMICIYEVRAGLIARAWFRFAKTPP